MEKAHSSILDVYRVRLKHYAEMGIGNKSKITGAKITKSMICICLDRYLELGGDLKSVYIDDKIYKEIISEVSML